MNQEEFEKQRELAVLQQAIMVSNWQQTECYQLIYNTLLQMEKNFKDKKMRLLETPSVSVKEVMIYYSGLEDCIGKVFEAINRIVADGEAVKQKDELLKNYQKEEV